MAECEEGEEAHGWAACFRGPVVRDFAAVIACWAARTARKLKLEISIVRVFPEGQLGVQAVSEASFLFLRQIIARSRAKTLQEPDPSATRRAQPGLLKASL